MQWIMLKFTFTSSARDAVWDHDLQRKIIEKYPTETNTFMTQAMFFLFQGFHNPATRHQAKRNQIVSTTKLNLHFKDRTPNNEIGTM